MRRKVGYCFVLLCLLFFAATESFAADSYVVTAGFGKEIQEQTPCGAIGSISMIPSSGDGWAIDQEITAYLLAGARICKAVDADFAYEGGIGTDYNILAVVGDQFFKITILESSATGQVYVPEGLICVNLMGTPYAPDDPNYQLVQASYRDSQSGSYSGDQYVATVIESLTPDPGDHPVGKGDKDNWEKCVGSYQECMDPKSGEIYIPLCGKFDEQSQDCWCAESRCSALLVVEDFDIGDYEFEFSISKPNVGLKGPSIYAETTAGCYPISSVTTTYFDFEDKPVTVGSCDDYLKVKKVNVKFASTYVNANFKFFFNFAYDCDAQPGDLTVCTRWNFCEEVQCPDVPPYCSWLNLGCIKICEFVSCDGPVKSCARTFPYVPNIDEDWWAGLAIANPNDSQITVNFDIYEMDGDKYTFSMAVPANGMKVGLFSDPLFFNPVPVGVEDGFGNEKFWMNAWSMNYFYGFLMLGDGVQAQGYLPEWTWD